jgi:hypothetical protein
MTTKNGPALYSQFLYESILKTAMKDPNFAFKTRLTPYPPTDFVQNRVEFTNTNTVVFYAAISYSMIITSIVSYLTVERLNGLKHLQLVCGVQLTAYWAANFMFDTLKLSLTNFVAIVLFQAFDMGFDSAWATLLALPFGIVPFTYMTSFLFTSDNAAQTFTMFFHFFVLGILSLLVFFLRLAPDLQNTGDVLHFALKAIPTYLIGSSLFCDTSCEALADARQVPSATGRELEPNVWAPSNNLLDITFMFLHFLFWFTVIALVERGVIRKCNFRLSYPVPKQAIELDSDVEKEEKRC